MWRASAGHIRLREDPEPDSLMFLGRVVVSWLYTNMVLFFLTGCRELLDFVI